MKGILTHHQLRSLLASSLRAQAFPSALLPLGVLNPEVRSASVTCLKWLATLLSVFQMGWRGHWENILPGMTDMKAFIPQHIPGLESTMCHIQQPDILFRVLKPLFLAMQPYGAQSTMTMSHSFSFSFQ